MKLFKKKDACIAESTAFEACVLCGALTDIRKSVPVDLRADYLPGAGQLCHECFLKNVKEEQAARRNSYVYALPLYEKE